MRHSRKSMVQYSPTIKDPAASNGVSNLQRYRAAGYLTLAAVAKCLQAATWLVARGNKKTPQQRCRTFIIYIIKKTMYLGSSCYNIAIESPALILVLMMISDAISSCQFLLWICRSNISTAFSHISSIG